jgi:hypothetical protein
MGVLVAAGGTGQEVAAGVMRIAYLSGHRPPEIFVIDSDLAGHEEGEARTRHQVVDQLHRRFIDTGAVPSVFLRVLNPANLNRPDTEPGAVRHVGDVFSIHGALQADDRGIRHQFVPAVDQH